MIRYGAKAEGPFPGKGGVGVKGGGLHLHGHHAHALPQVHLAAAGGGVEVIGGEEVAHFDIRAMLPGGFHGGGEQGEVRDGGKAALQAELVYIIGVRAGTLPGHQIHELQIIPYGAGGADADDVFHAVKMKKLPAVYADGGHAHARGHHRHWYAFPTARVPLDAADVVHKHGVREKVLRDELGPEGVAGHEDGSGDVLLFCVYMGCGN